MSCQGEQEEEAEVLLSIYEGDPCFRQTSPSSYHYRYGEENSSKDFVVEIKWGQNYPNEIPEINLDLFCNGHIVASVRDTIKAALVEQANNNTGMPMTFTLFEWLRENAEMFIAAQPERAAEDAGRDQKDCNFEPQQRQHVVKKEKLTKSQKRKMAGRVVHGELPRGHDWVDVVKHLLQSGAAS